MNIKKLFLYMGAILTLSLVTMCVTTVNDNAGKEETVICRGQEAHTSGPMVKVGQQAPNFQATNAEMKEVSLSSFKGETGHPEHLP